MKPLPDIIGEIVTDDVTLLGPPPETNTTPARGFFPYDAENRTQRRAASATWQPPEGQEDSEGLRRRLLEQRKRIARGTLDVKLRRAQRKAARGNRKNR